MKNKMKIAICAIAVMTLSMVVTPIAFAQVGEGAGAVAANIEPRTDILEWRYKVIDGHFYKRLFNASTGRWVTDWILVQ